MKKIILINFTLIISFFLIFEIFLRVFNLSSLRGMSEHYFFNNKNIEGKAFGIKFLQTNMVLEFLIKIMNIIQKIKI